MFVTGADGHVAEHNAARGELGISGGTTRASVQAAIDEAEPIGGRVVLGPGVINLDGRLSVPSTVTLVGAGGGIDVTQEYRSSTMFVASVANAGIDFDAGGGESSGFVVHGDDVATSPLMKVGLGSNRSFRNIHLTHGLGVGLEVKQCQNAHFQGIIVTYCDDLLVIDEGAGGNMFQSCMFTHATSHHLVIDQTTVNGPYPPALGPSHNTWDHCLFERGVAGALAGCVDIHAGTFNKLRDCGLSTVDYTTTQGLLRINTDAAEGTFAEIHLDTCWLFGDGSAVVGIEHNGGGVWMFGRSQFQALGVAWEFNAGYGARNPPHLLSAVDAEFGGSGDKSVLG